MHRVSPLIAAGDLNRVLIYREKDILFAIWHYKYQNGISEVCVRSRLGLDKISTKTAYGLFDKKKEERHFCLHITLSTKLYGVCVIPLYVYGVRILLYVHNVCVILIVWRAHTTILSLYATQHLYALYSIRNPCGAVSALWKWMFDCINKEICRTHIQKWTICCIYAGNMQNVCTSEK